MSCLYRKGAVTQKKLGRSVRCQLLLASPLTADHLRSVYDSIAESDEGQTLPPVGTLSHTAKTVEVLGQLSFAALQSIPVLVIGSTKRIFVQFSQVMAIYDENDLQQACSFVIALEETEFRFSCDSSTDYLAWINVLNYALDVSRGAKPSGPMENQDPDDIYGQPLTLKRLSRAPTFRSYRSSKSIHNEDPYISSPPDTDAESKKSGKLKFTAKMVNLFKTKNVPPKEQ